MSSPPERITGDLLGMVIPPESGDGQWQPTWTFVPNGMHLSDSRATPGANRNILRDDITNHLRGPAESIPMHDFNNSERTSYRPHHDSPPTELVISTAVTAAVTVIVNALIENIDWTSVTHRAQSGAKGAANSLRHRAYQARRRLRGKHREEPEQMLSGSNLAQVDQRKATINGDEFRARVQAILAAEAFAAWQRANLTQVTIDETEFPAGLNAAINLVLEGKETQLSPHQTHLVVEFFNTEHTTKPELLAAPLHHDLAHHQLEVQHIRRRR